jgi:replicative DNA helicase
VIEKQIIKLLLEKNFYNKYKGHIASSVFDGNYGSLFATIQKAHEEYEQDISLDDLYSLHTTKYNPALTRAMKIAISELIEDIRETEKPNNQIAEDIIRILRERDVAQKVAVEATEIYNGASANFSSIKKIIEDFESNKELEEVDAVTDNIGELLNQLQDTTKWKFNINVLKENVGGIGPGNFMIVFARPETGKTAFWVSLVANENGFAQQGAKIHAFINEEPAVRTQMRAINCWTGYTKQEIIDNLKESHELWSEIKDNIKMLDVVDWSMDDVDAHCEKYKPDIIVIDQLDKVNVKGTFARTDEKLRAVYTSAREIAKKHQCAVIAISQASADAHNKHTVTFDMMENSKTGKAAEADLIIGIGKKQIDPQVIPRDRSLCISKNKITGFHGDPIVAIEPETSRYID